MPMLPSPTLSSALSEVLDHERNDPIGIGPGDGSAGSSAHFTGHLRLATALSAKLLSMI